MAGKFVPCADEVYRLQRGTDPECRLFQRFADQGHYKSPGGTRQGLYVVTAGGRLLASCNHRDARKVRSTMVEGLAAFAALEPAERGLDPEIRGQLESNWRWDHEYPEDGLVLELTCRDLDVTRPDEASGADSAPTTDAPSTSDPTSRPAAGTDSQPSSRPAGTPKEWNPHVRRDGRPLWHGGAWNRDHVWFRREEIDRWIPEDAAVGATFRLPATVSMRLARFHMVDIVRGQVMPFRLEQVAEHWLEGTVTGVEPVAGSDSGRRLTIRWRGHSRAEVPDGEHPRSMVLDYGGTATWDGAAGRFTAFDLMAAGHRTGRGRFNARSWDADGSQVGYVLRRAPPDAPRIAPAWIWGYGWRPQRH